VVLIHRFDVLGVDQHCHKFSSPNSLYFSQNRRFPSEFPPKSTNVSTSISRKSLSWKKPANRLAQVSPLDSIAQVNATIDLCSVRLDHSARYSALALQAPASPCSPTTPEAAASSLLLPIRTPLHLDALPRATQRHSPCVPLAHPSLAPARSSSPMSQL
jgi:hypothetical protein